MAGKGFFLDLFDNDPLLDWGGTDDFWKMGLNQAAFGGGRPVALSDTGEAFAPAPSAPAAGGSAKSPLADDLPILNAPDGGDMDLADTPVLASFFEGPPVYVTYSHFQAETGFAMAALDDVGPNESDPGGLI